MSENKSQNKIGGRNFGVDLLRCVAMMMVVCLHTLARSEVLTNTPVPSAKYEIVWLMEIFSYCAVDCFVIISGYVGLKSKFKVSRIILLWLQVVFYNAGLTIFFQCIHHSFDAKELVLSFLPVMSNSHWFFTQYFILSLLMPFINKLVNSLSVKQNVTMVGALVAVFSIIPMISAYPALVDIGFKDDPFYTQRGYSVIWFVVIYTIGAVIRRVMDDTDKLKRANGFIWLFSYVACCGVVWVVHYLCVNVGDRISHNFIVSYTSPFVVMAAVSLLMLFMKFRFNKPINKIIAFFSSSAFAVYIIHSQNDVFPVYKALVLPMQDMRIIKLVPAVVFTIVFVFVSCVLVDSVRARLEKLIRIDKLLKRLDK